MQFEFPAGSSVWPCGNWRGWLLLYKELWMRLPLLLLVYVCGETVRHVPDECGRGEGGAIGKPRGGRLENKTPY